MMAVMMRVRLLIYDCDIAPLSLVIIASQRNILHYHRSAPSFDPSAQLPRCR